MAETYEDLLGNPAIGPSANTYEDLIREQTGADYKPYTEEMKASDAAGMKSLAGAGIVGAAAATGGMALAPYGALASLAGEMGGTFLGELGRQKTFGEDTDVGDATQSALISLGLGGLSRTAVKAYGALADIPAEYTRYIGKKNPVRGFGLTMREPMARAELDLGRNIGRTVRNISSEITEPRQELVAIMAQRSVSGPKISVRSVIDALEQSKVPKPRLPETLQANAKIDERIAALTRAESSGGLTASELDTLINKELDPTAFNQSGEVATTKVGPAYASARDAARETLLANLPPEARLLKEQIAEELMWRENAAKYFGLKKSGKTVVGNVAKINQPGNEEIKQTLKFISEQSGIDFEKMAMDLATRRAYTMDDRVKMGVINRIMLGMATMGAVTGRPGAGLAVLAVSPVAAHTISKVIAPLQNVTGPAGISLYEYLRSSYSMRTGQEIVKPKPGSAIMKITRIKNQEAVADAMIKATRTGAGGSY